jgi:hypothetical protein
VPDSTEIILHAQDDLHLWRGPKPGATILGAHIGRALLTNRRFLFLSAATSGALRAGIAAAALGSLGALAFGRTSTDGLDLSAIDDEGGLAIELSRISAVVATRRWDLTNYLRIDFAEPTGEPSSCVFLPRGKILWGGAKTWAEQIEQARAAATALPYRVAQ